MFTQCPQCHTVFRVTATMLKAAQGRVRCGRCAHVFNALNFLIEPDDAAALARSRTPAPESRPVAPVESTATQDEAPGDEVETQIDDVELPGDDAEAPGDDVEEIVLDSGDIPESALEFTANDLSKVFVLETAPTLPRPVAVAVAVTDEDTAEHEILDIELETLAEGTTDSGEDQTGEPGDVTEMITLEGDSVVLEEGDQGDSVVLEEGDQDDSVVLEEEDPSVSGAYFVIEEPRVGTAQPQPGGADRRSGAAPASGDRRSAAPSPYADRRSGADRRRSADGVDLSFGSVAKQAAPTSEAIDDEVQREIEAAFAADPTTRAEFTLPSGRRLEIGPAAGTTADEAEPHDTLHAQKQQHRRVMLAWAGASAFLALTLALQVLHHNRQSLARNAAIGPALTGLYSAIGNELSPEWNVRAYELRQFGAAADADAQGTLRVRASLLNGAVHAQPYPVLRLTLQDRFGGRVGLRDLQPREYLRSAPSRNALIGAGQRIDADIAIVDPGQDAVGFEIDVCLPASAQGLTCANDAARNAG